MKFQIKYISLFLTAVLLVSMLPAQAFAYDAENSALRGELTEALKGRASELDIRKYGIFYEDFDALFREVVATENGMWHVSNYKRTTSQGIMVKAYFEYVPVKEELAIRSAASYAVSSCIQSGMSDVQKALALHDYLALGCAQEQATGKVSAYDAMISGKAAGQGYAQAYRILLEQVGIPSRVVTSDTMNHAWNLVQIGGQWYHVDVTRDDPRPDIAGRVAHDHFLRSDAAMTEEGYLNWEADMECINTAFDAGMYWENVSSPIQVRQDGTILLRRDGTGSVEILRVNPADGSETLVFENRNSNYTYNGQQYQTVTGGLSEYNGMVYFGDLTKIYSLSNLSGAPRTVCTVSDFGDWHYFVSSHVDGDTLYVTVANHATGAREVLSLQLDTPHSHVWGEWVETLKPDENHNGVRARACVTCGVEETQPIPNNPFPDVGENNSFKTYILWNYYNGIISGDKQGKFNPDNTVTRGQFIIMLWRAAGKPEPAQYKAFPDVRENSSFYKAVCWAVEKGITNGKKDGNFGVNDPCTRGHVALFLYRYAGEPEVQSKKSFPDVTGGTYYKAVCWMVEQGITNGQNDGTFGVSNACKRTHVTKFLYLYLIETELYK